MNYISNQYYLLVLFGELSLQQVRGNSSRIPPAAFPQPPSSHCCFLGVTAGPLAFLSAFALPAKQCSGLHIGAPPVPPGVSLPAPPTGRPIWALCCLCSAPALPWTPTPSLSSRMPPCSHFIPCAPSGLRPELVLALWPSSCSRALLGVAFIGAWAEWPCNHEDWCSPQKDVANFVTLILDTECLHGSQRHGRYSASSVHLCLSSRSWETVGQTLGFSCRGERVENREGGNYHPH